MNTGPFIKQNNTTGKMMKNLFLALLPLLIFTFYKNGLLPFIKGYATFYGMMYPLLLLLVGIITSYFSEYFYFRVLKHQTKVEIKEELRHSFPIFPGLFLSLIVPYNTPLLLMVFASFIATFFGKMLYGGFGHNLFNPALIGCFFLLTMYGGYIAKMGGYFNTLEMDTVSFATPLSNAQGVDGIGSYATLVAPYGTLWDFFLGTIPGALGETSALLCLCAFFFLSFKRVIKWKIPAFYIGTVFLLTLCIGKANGMGLWYPCFQVLSGGLFFGAIFMATDPVTSPITSIGQVLYAIFLGISTVTCRYLTPLPEGVLTSILTLNLFVPILDKIGSMQGIAIKKVAVPLLACLFCSFLLIQNVCLKYAKKDATDSNFQIIDKKTMGKETTYVVTQKGNGGLIKIEFVLEGQKIKTMKVLEEHETDAYFQMVMDAAYIDTLLQNQEKIEEVDTISGATISSKALKKSIMNVLKEEGILR